MPLMIFDFMLNSFSLVDEFYSLHCLLATHFISYFAACITLHIKAFDTLIIFDESLIFDIIVDEAR